MKKILLLSFVSLLIQTSYAQWNTDVTTNSAICSTTPQAARGGTVVTTDLTGAMYIAWVDSRTTASGSVYMQKADLTNPQFFAEDGVLVATSATAISNLSITPDGAGGAILAWQTNNDIFAQRVNAAGATVWTNPMPLSVSTAPNQTSPQITIVSASQAMVAFNDNRNGNTDIYLNKIAISTGNLLLTIDTPVCKATGTQNQFSIIPDLVTGGAYIAWSDGRATGNIDLYALRVKNDGLAETGWTVDGTQICNATGTQSNSVIVPDLAGGVYIAWEDFRAGNTDVYAQRMSAAGAAAWDANGVVVSNPTGNQQGPQAWPVNDGVIISWTDARAGNSNRDIYAQKMIAGTGTASWTANGVVVCDATDQQPSATTSGLKVVSDNANGAIIVWNDQRNGNTNRDIYAQRINNSGNVQWTANGIVVSSATGNQGPDIGVIPITASNGAFIVWQDSRSGTTNGEIYGAVINGTGNLTSSVRDRILLEGEISAYPVPTQNQITVSLSKVKPGNYIVQVIDVSGRMMLQHKTSVNGSEGTIVTNVQSLQRGNYYLRLTHESSKAETLLSFTKQ